MQSTIERVQKVVADVMSISPARVTPQTDINKDLGPDSLEQVEIIISLENEFGTNLGFDEESEPLDTIENLVIRIDETLGVRTPDIQYL